MKLTVDEIREKIKFMKVAQKQHDDLEQQRKDLRQKLQEFSETITSGQYCFSGINSYIADELSILRVKLSKLRGD